MRTDKQLADALVERGVGCSLQGYYAIHPTISGPLAEGRPPNWFQLHSMLPKDFCHDWRVAGACMERMHGYQIISMTDNFWGATAYGQIEYGFDETDNCADASNESLPRAIIEAFVEATNE